MSKRRLLIGGLSMVLISLFGLVGRASAATTIEQKALAYDILKCYTYQNSDIINATNSGSNIASVVTVEDIRNNGIDAVFKRNLTVPGTSVFGSRGELRSITCQQLFAGHEAAGDQYFKGLLGYTGLINKTEEDKFSTKDMERLGYRFETNGSCIFINFTRTSDQGHLGSEKLRTNQVCGNSPSEGEVIVNNDHQDELGLKIQKYGTDGLEIKSSYIKDANGNSSIILDSVLSEASSMDDLGSRLASALAVFDGRQGVGGLYRYSLSSDKKWGKINQGKYVLDGDRKQVALKVANNLLGTSFKDISDLSFNANEAYALYFDYLEKFYGLSIANDNIKCNYSDSDIGFYENSSQWVGAPMVYEGAIKTCFIDTNGQIEHKNEKVYGLDGAGYYSGLEKTWMEILEQLNGLKDGLSIEGILATDRANSDSDGEPTLDCSSGAGPLGWIICPIINGLTSAVEGLYDFVSESLTIDSQLFSQNKNEGVIIAWSTFQGFSNTLFVIFLLAIIISQLTGFGIDNYGIKKMLPKLIIAAVLVNLSFYICVLMIDLSNILGSGVKGLFDSLPTANTVQSISVDGHAVNVTSTVDMVGVGVLTGLAAGIGYLSNPMNLLTLLVASIGVVVSLFFLFVLLAVREAAVVVLTVMSPIAFVLYILPNSRVYFNRYLKIFTMLLLLFPLCSLVVSGGSYVSRLLLSTDYGNVGLPQAFTAVIIGIAPIFFIPQLVRSSMSGLGGLGTKISGLGKTIGSNLQRGAQSSNAFKGLQSLAGEHNIRRNAGLDIAGNRRDLNPFQIAMMGGERNIARNRNAYLANEKRKQTDKELMGEGYDAALIQQRKSAEDELIENQVTLLNHATRNGENEDKLFEMVNEALFTNGGNRRVAIAAARIAGRRGDTAKRFADEYLKIDPKTDERLKSEEAKQAYENVFDGVAKEVATGKTSSTYMATDPFAFKYAAEYNKAPDKGLTYEDWKNSNNNRDENGNITKNNIDEALKLVTTREQLNGMKGSSLKELCDMMQNNLMSLEEQARIMTLAADTIRNKDRIEGYDSSKEEYFIKLAGSMLAGASATGGAVANQGGNTVNNVNVNNNTSNVNNVNSTTYRNTQSDGLDIPHFMNKNNGARQKKSSSNDDDVEIPGFMNKR